MKSMRVSPNPSPGPSRSVKPRRRIGGCPGTSPGCGCPTSLPFNVASRHPYRGVNVPALWAAGEAKGYASGLWGTYEQWTELGSQVRKGERSTTVVFWRFPVKPESAAEESGQEEGKEAKLARDNVPQLSEEARRAAVDGFFSAIPGLDLRHGGAAAFYNPTSDLVQTRLARDLSHRFGSAAYAAEGLVAELGAAFICPGLGISTEPRLDHAQYIAYWLRLLKGDARAIFSAASKAQQAADWLMTAAASPICQAA